MASKKAGSAPAPRYAVWNNKGGVGKTFLSFVVASEYAERFPDRPVVVVDMCPQANVSEILLGGNGKGSAELNKLLSMPTRRSVGGYFDQRISQPHSKTGSESSFLTEAAKVNRNLPANLFCVAGDPSLEVQTQAINQIAGQSLPQAAWANVHRWLGDLLDGIASYLPKPPVFFIDCNPSFSAYTEIALLAANRIIVPCTADGSSARAIDNLGQLLFGIGLPAAYKGASFSELAEKHGMPLPSIHMVPLNRSTQYDKKASKAFTAMYEEIQKRVVNLKKKRPQNFSSDDPFLDIPDAHSVSVVASHEGVPLSKVRLGAHDIHGVTCQVNPEPMERYKGGVAKLVDQL